LSSARGSSNAGVSSRAASNPSSSDAAGAASTFAGRPPSQPSASSVTSRSTKHKFAWTSRMTPKPPPTRTGSFTRRPIIADGRKTFCKSSAFFHDGIAA